MATIYGTSGADILRGTRGADTIYGRWGYDRLEGRAGRDYLDGSNGNDTLDGGPGHDVLDGGGGFDLALYSNYLTPVVVDLRSTAPNGPGDTLLNIEAIDGGYGSDRLIGSGAGNRFWGASGADTLIGNVGSDTLLGGGGGDSLDGGNGADRLVGSFGNDVMRGGAHDDFFGIGAIGQEDADGGNVALVEYGRDVIDGGAGTDTLAIEGPIVATNDDWVTVMEAPPVRANLGVGTLRIGDSENRSTLISIENIETGSGADSINGSSGDDFISAGDGANVVYAGAGNDTIVGGASRLYNDGNVGAVDPVELLNGGDGDDVIYGMGSVVKSATDSVEYPGTDILTGADGNDTIYGGSGIQFMTGGSGDDMFILSDDLSTTHGMPEYMTTTISDFEGGKDKIGFNLSRYTGEITFVGEVDGRLNPGELVYHQDGMDTYVDLGIYDENSAPNGAGALSIVLSGYTGPLSASDFDLG